MENASSNQNRMKAVYNGSMQSIISGGGLTAHRDMHIDHEVHAVINQAAHGGSIGAAARAMGRGNCTGNFKRCPK